ncbi:E3 ubiquitin-protein ligase SIAH1A-like [Gordionus sp. m RMFG-2023]|uniref:E3 ubiquitin-protein ligase SIAH1A-like n=1 Tax=Gordionus sp. m RMFG-2023 TaxID=3053472 RepID=UPI0031FC3CA0
MNKNSKAGKAIPFSSDSNENDITSFFECPVCFDYVLPPIYQCRSGHLVCSLCRLNLKCCPTCRGPLGNIRNLAMEKVASTILFPCKYNNSGCNKSLSHTEKVEHEEICEFRPYVCPCPGASCKWQGSLEQVMSHLLVSHKTITTLQGEDIVFLATDINLPGNVDWVMMQSCFGHHFILVLEKQERLATPAPTPSALSSTPSNNLPSSNLTPSSLDHQGSADGGGGGSGGHAGHAMGVSLNRTPLQQFYAVVQLIGSRKQAENFAYKLELNGNGRRLTWEARPRSVHEGIANAIAKCDCLVFESGVASLFAENGNLAINVTITSANGSANILAGPNSPPQK